VLGTHLRERPSGGIDVSIQTASVVDPMDETPFGDSVAVPPCKNHPSGVVSRPRASWSLTMVLSTQTPDPQTP
jgi:hypothetical protein